MRRIWSSRFIKSISRYALFLSLWLGSLPGFAQEVIEFPKSELSIITKQSEVVFVIELADTPERRARGYMFREDIPKGTGMLFDFGVVRPVAMWMKNTPSSLDMMFIDAAGKIRHIFEHTEPFSEAVLASPVQVLAVFEVAAGTVAEHGIGLGDQVVHGMFER